MGAAAELHRLAAGRLHHQSVVAVGDQGAAQADVVLVQLDADHALAHAGQDVDLR